MAKFGATILLALSLGLVAGANAQIPDTSGSDPASTFEQSGKPTRGMTQGSVEESFGSPQKTQPAIGDPPITRWEYPEFVVFFEYDKVIHSVTKR